MSVAGSGAGDEGKRVRNSEDGKGGCIREEDGHGREEEKEKR